jgi:hypothetical protein
MAAESKPRLFVCKYPSLPERLGAGCVISLAGRLELRPPTPGGLSCFNRRHSAVAKKRDVDSLAQGVVIGPISSGDRSKIDALIEVARTLKDARSIAERCSNKTLVYFLDMAIFEVCEALAALRSLGSA